MKCYVLDTNVLLNNPTSIDGFDDNLVIIPMVVLEELDGLKKGKESVSIASRAVARRLDELRLVAKEQGSSLQKGVKLDNGGELRIHHPEQELEYTPTMYDNNDNMMLMQVMMLQKELTCPIIFVTKDINLRVKADGLNILCEDYNKSVVENRDIYEGIQTIEIEDPELANSVWQDDQTTSLDYAAEVQEEIEAGKANVYYRIAGSNGNETLLRSKNDELIRIDQRTVSDIYSLNPRNYQQMAALDAMLDEDIKCVVITGVAGTGKSLLALAAGLQQAVNGKKYKRVIITRPTVNVGGGKGEGFLPGDLREKLDPWVAPFYDAFENLTSQKNAKRAWEDLEEFKQIDIQSLSHVRGRSFKNLFVICDEAQNMSQLEAKTLITRVAEGSKIVLLGDTEQIDNPYLNQYSNGLAHAIDKLSGQKIFAHVCLKKSERGELAELAAKLL